MKNTYTFAPDSLTVNAKTFPARYALQDEADMKRGQLYPTVYIYATVDEKTVKIAVPADDSNYSAALTACKAAQEAPAQPEEAPEAPQGEAPAQPEAIQPEEAPAAPQEEAAQPEEAPAAPQEEAEPASPQPQEEPTAPDPKQPHAPIPEKTFVGTTITGARYQIIFDGEAQRTRVIIPDEYKAQARAAIENAGFFYSSRLDSWNKKLTFRAYRAAQALAAELDKIFAA